LIPDGVPGRHDNCPAVFNPDQAGTDQDGVGDAWDPCPCRPQTTTVYNLAKNWLDMVNPFGLWTLKKSPTALLEIRQPDRAGSGQRARADVCFYWRIGFAGRQQVAACSGRLMA